MGWISETQLLTQVFRIMSEIVDEEGTDGEFYLDSKSVSTGCLFYGITLLLYSKTPTESFHGCLVVSAPVLEKILRFLPESDRRYIDFLDYIL